MEVRINKRAAASVCVHSYTAHTSGSSVPGAGKISLQTIPDNKYLQNYLLMPWTIISGFPYMFDRTGLDIAQGIYDNPPFFYKLKMLSLIFIF